MTYHENYDNEADTPETPITEGSRFRVFPMDPQTEALGYSLSDANIMVIRNLIAAHAHDHLQLQFDDEKPHKVAIQQAYIRGAIESLEHLLNSHREIVAARAEQSRSQY